MNKHNMDEIMTEKEMYRFVSDLIGFGSQPHTGQQSQEKKGKAIETIKQKLNQVREERTKEVLKEVDTWFDLTLEMQQVRSCLPVNSSRPEAIIAAKKLFLEFGEELIKSLKEQESK